MNILEFKKECLKNSIKVLKIFPVRKSENIGWCVIWCKQLDNNTITVQRTDTFWNQDLSEISLINN